MSEFTPTTEEVKLAYCDSEYIGHNYTEQGPEFDRWLEAHDREVTLAALRKIGSEMWREDREYIEERASEIENGDTL